MRGGAGPWRAGGGAGSPGRGRGELTWRPALTASTAQVKGTGTVNGEDGYIFQLLATDGGKSDKVRLTIWDSEDQVLSDSEIVYRVPDRPLTKGSIIIHKGK